MAANAQTAISVRNIAKSYQVACQEEKPAYLTQAILSRLKRSTRRASSETFWALQDVSFDVNKGQVIGIIGRNGAGKSTLLKILSRITEPTHGEVHLYGRVGSLLEVGTGFHPELTGRENVYLNGQILGMRRAEIDRQFDAIIDFAEVERFIDTPVKRYSSGMYVRLAFAVAAHLNPEILIVDEVLAVGDAQFQKKCLGKMKEVSSENRTVLFVSHNMQAVTSLCDSALLLESGQIAQIGETSATVARYLASGQVQKLHRSFTRSGGALSLLDMRVHQPGSAGPIVTSKPILLTCVVESRPIAANDYICGFTLCDGDGARVFSTYFNDLGDYDRERLIGGERTLTCSIPPHFLNEGLFTILLDIGIAKVQRFTSDDVHCLSFEVTNPDGVGARFGLGRAWRGTPLAPLMDWQIT